jgi:hypothetical protein
LGFLPSDVNADGTADPLDITALVKAVGDATMAMPLRSADIDRSGVVSASDILRVIDLLNGAESFAASQGTTLP